MGKILKRFSMGAVGFLLAVSISFCSVTERYYAVETVVTYSTWELWTLLFASLGISIDRAGTLSDDERVAEMETTVLDYMNSLENVESTPLEEATDFVQNIGNYVVDGALTISDSVYDGFRQFVNDVLVVDTIYSSLSSVNLYSLSKDDFYSVVGSFLDISDSVRNSSAYTSFISNLYSDYSSLKSFGNASFYIYSFEQSSGKIIGYVCFPAGEMYITSDGYFSHNNYASFDSLRGYMSLKLDGSVYYQNNSSYGIRYSYDFPLFVVNGGIFDFKSILKDVTSSNKIGISDFDIPHDVLSQYIYNDVFTSSISDVYDDGAYDVITPGREYDDKKNEVVGDVVLPVPGTSVFDKLESGEITWEQFLDEVGVQPIDTAEGTDLLTGEFLDTQAGILSGVQDIVDFLNGLVEGLVNAFLEMLLSLVLPADGFIEGKIGELQTRLNALGIAPYDMSVIFDDGGGGNPFKDITVEYYGQKVVIVSFQHLDPFITEFRPVIRGLLVLFLLYYSINHLLGLFRLSGMMEGGNSNPIQIGVGSNVPQIADKGGKR